MYVNIFIRPLYKEYYFTKTQKNLSKFQQSNIAIFENVCPLILIKNEKNMCT